MSPPVPDYLLHWVDGGWAPPEPPARWLSAAEVARWELLGPHADAYVRKRWLLRVAMGAVFSTDLDVEQTCPHCGSAGHGPLRARLGSGAWRTVSLSSHGDLAAATAGPGRVGVDVVLVDEARDAALDHAWTARERSLVDATADAALMRARLWARKEAALKAVGLGLRVEPGAVEVLAGVVFLAGAHLHLSDQVLPGHRAVLAHAHDGPATPVLTTQTTWVSGGRAGPGSDGRRRRPPPGPVPGPPTPPG